MYVILYILVSNILHIMIQCMAFDQKLKDKIENKKK